MNRNQKIKKITGVGVMLALTIVLQIVSSISIPNLILPHK